MCYIKTKKTCCIYVRKIHGVRRTKQKRLMLVTNYVLFIARKYWESSRLLSKLGIITP